MKNYRINMTHRAIEDLKNIGSYIGNDLKEPLTARKIINNIKVSIMSLEEMPTGHPLLSVEIFLIQGLRRIFVENYIVFYIVTEEDSTVTIVRVLYQRRNWINLL